MSTPNLNELDTLASACIAIAITSLPSVAKIKQRMATANRKVARLVERNVSAASAGCPSPVRSIVALAGPLASAYPPRELRLALRAAR